VLGVYFITVCQDDVTKIDEKTVPRFKDRHEAILAFDQGKIDIHEPISVRLAVSGIASARSSTAQKGEVEPMPGGQPPHRHDRGAACSSATSCPRACRSTTAPWARRAAPRHRRCLRLLRQAGHDRPARRHEVDRLQAVHRRGPQLRRHRPAHPDREAELLDAAQKRVNRVEKNYENGIITERERYNQLLDIWSHCNEELTKVLVETLKHDRRDPDGSEADIEKGEGTKYLNPVYLMSDSGARGNISQMKQLAGMRGLMAKPSGEIIETPIRRTSARA
jgi:DNA-directed RNA polymerase subunit beta'